MLISVREWTNAINYSDFIQMKTYLFAISMYYFLLNVTHMDLKNEIKNIALFSTVIVYIFYSFFFVQEHVVYIIKGSTSIQTLNAPLCRDLYLSTLLLSS